MSTPLTRCPSCNCRMRPDVGAPLGPGIDRGRYSRVECTDCGKKLGTLEWELL